MRKATNSERIEGRVYQHSLTVKTVQNQTSANFMERNLFLVI